MSDVGLYLGKTYVHPKVQVGKDQEKAQPEKDSHSKNRGGKKPNQQSGTYTMKHTMKPERLDANHDLEFHSLHYTLYIEI